MTTEQEISKRAAGVGLLCVLAFGQWSLAPILEGEMLTYAQLVSWGDRPYLDFFEIHAPACYLIPGWLARLGVDPGIGAIALLRVAFAATSLLCYALMRKRARRMVSLAGTAAFTLAAIHFQANDYWPDVFLPAFYLAAMLALEVYHQRGALGYVALGGLLAGIALLWKQTALGPMSVILLLALFFRGPGRRPWIVTAAVYAAAAAVPLIAFAFYLAQIGALSEAFYGLVAAHLTDMTVLSRRRISILEFTAVAPLFYGWFHFFWAGVRAAVHRRFPDPSAEAEGAGVDPLVIRCALIGASTLLAALNRISFVTVYPMLPFTVALGVWALFETRGTARRDAGSRFTASAFVAILALMTPIATVVRGVPTELQNNGLLRRYAAWSEAGRWVRDRYPEAREIFVFGHPIVYYTSGLRPITRYINLEPVFHRLPGIEAEVIRDLERHPEAPVVYFKIPHAGATPFRPPDRWDYYEEIRRYLRQNYRVVRELPKSVVVLVRKDEASSAGNRSSGERSGRDTDANRD